MPYPISRHVYVSFYTDHIQFLNLITDFFQFSDWQNADFLNPSSDLDICALHLVCSQLLSRTIDKFSEGWNNHPLSTERSQSPIKLFRSGILNLMDAEGDDSPELYQVIFFRELIIFIYKIKIFSF